MKQASRIFAWMSGWFLAICLFSGCTSVRVVYRAPDFHYTSILAGQLGIGGITPAEDLAYMEQDRLAAMIAERLHSRWPRVKILSMDEVRQTLGDAEHRRMLDAFANLAVLSQSDLERLRPLASKSRYLMLVDIRQNEVYHTEGSGPRYERSSTYNPYTRSYEETDSFDGYVSWNMASRLLKCVFVVYDLKDCRHVWIATGSTSASSGSESRNYYHPPALIPSGAPPTSQLMEAILRRLVRRLPSS